MGSIYYKCESLFELLLPYLYLNLREAGYADLYNFYKEMVNRKINSANTVTSEQLLLSYTKDLSVFYTKCNQLESNLIYIFMFIDNIKPLVLTLVFISFVIPIMWCGMFFLLSMYLYMSKRVGLKV